MMRRLVIGGLGAAALMSLTAPARAQAKSTRSSNRDVLVFVFLRGGADGINLVVPHGDEEYYAQRRPSGLGIDVAIAREELTDLDGYFGLHPGLADLAKAGGAWSQGNLACIFGVGDPAGNRSHFRNMDRLELGNGRETGQSGWLARYLALSQATVREPLARAVAINYTTPLSLAGAPGVLTLPRLDGFQLGDEPAFIDTLDSLYLDDSTGNQRLRSEGQSVLNLLGSLERTGVLSDNQANHPDYPDAGLGPDLYAAARIIDKIGDVEAICIDRGGWDTHSEERHRLDPLASELGRSLQAFYADLKSTGRNATVVVMSEFGRRMAANGSKGTDHGFGSLALVMGPQVNGGIYAKSGPDQPWTRDSGSFIQQMTDANGDMKVTTDYRAVIGHVLQQRLGFSTAHDWEALFPGHGREELAWRLFG